MTTGLVYRCRRAGCVVLEVHPDPAVALRRAVESGQLAIVHECSGVLSVCDLVSTGPGTAWQSPTFEDAAQRAPEARS
jgi:hypothetical protein